MKPVPKVVKLGGPFFGYDANLVEGTSTGLVRNREWPYYPAVLSHPAIGEQCSYTTRK